jgi:hypothetical protein
MEAVIFGRDERINVGREIKNQSGEREDERAQAAVAATMNELKIAAGAVRDRMFRYRANSLDEATSLAGDDGVHVGLRLFGTVG